MSVHCKASVMKSLGCERNYLPKSNGNELNHSYPRCEARGDRGRITAGCLKAFYGCLKPGRAGGIFPGNILLRPHAGDACEDGKSVAYGWTSGASSCANSMSEGGWTGARAFWTGVLLPLKRGLRSRKNQARQGNEVDGGGRRLGYSSGKPACQREPGGSDTGRIDPSSHQHAPQETSARHCRPRLRQRSTAG